MRPSPKACDADADVRCAVESFGYSVRYRLARGFERGLGKVFFAAREVVVERSIGDTAFGEHLREPGGGVALVAE